MRYWVYVAGVYTGLWMRQYDEDQRRVIQMVCSARNFRGDLYDAFTNVFLNWEKTPIPSGSIIIKEPNAIQRTVGKWFDNLTTKYLVHGLYNFEDIEIQVTEKESEKD